MDLGLGSSEYSGVTPVTLFPPKVDPRKKALRYFETSNSTGSTSHRRHRRFENMKRLSGLIWLRLGTGGGLL